MINREEDRKENRHSKRLKIRKEAGVNHTEGNGTFVNIIEGTNNH